MKTTIVLLTSFSRTWHALDPADRRKIEEEHLQPLVGRYTDRLSIRFFNSLGFDPRFSHMVVIEAADLRDYYFFIEEFRDNHLLARGFVTIERIILGYEDGYPQFDAAEGAHAGAGVPA
jgi:hypothetical protein